MRGRTTIILVIIALVLLVVYVTSRRAERASEQLESGPIFPDAEWTATTEILMMAAADTVRLRKEDERWLVATDGNYPADTVAVGNIFDRLASFDRRHLISHSPEMQATFEVDDSSGTEVLLRDASGNRMAHFRVGKNGPDFRSQYIRPVGSNEVFKIPEYLKSTFDAGRATWRDRSIFQFEREKVQRLVFHPEEGGPFTVEKQEDDTYRITAPDTIPAQRNVIESAVRTLSALRCDAFPDTVPTPADAGLEPPRRRVEIHLEDGAFYGLDFGADTEPARVYARRDGADTIYLLSTGRMDTLVPDLEDVREEPPPEPAEMPEALETPEAPAPPEAGAEEAEAEPAEGGAAPDPESADEPEEPTEPIETDE